MRIIVISLISLFIYFGFSSCSNTITNPADIVFPEENVSYLEHVEPFLRLICSYQGCHSYSSPAGGIDMSNYHSLMISYGSLLVRPNQPDESILVQMLEYTLPHSYGYQWPVNENHKKGIRTWINEGARNN